MVILPLEGWQCPTGRQSAPSGVCRVSRGRGDGYGVEGGLGSVPASHCYWTIRTVSRLGQPRRIPTQRWRV